MEEAQGGHIGMGVGKGIEMGSGWEVRSPPACLAEMLGEPFTKLKFGLPDVATNEPVNEDDENVERGNWSSKTDYLLSVIGSAVGLGNVWRFPYLAYKNGGAVFLIPYTLMLALVGMPLFFLETSFGQFASLSPVAIWKAVPMLQGYVGLTMILVVITAIGYATCILAYSLYYLFASFQSPLPWADCFSWWGADETCSRTPNSLCNLTLDDGYFQIINTTWLQANNESCPHGSEISILHQGPSEQYWDKVVLRRSGSMDETGEILWYLALCLLLVWLIMGAALSKGIKSSGKVVYFTVTFPYVVLTILLIQGLTLEGANKGIQFYIGNQSDFSKLADAEVWKDAATQIVYSLAVAVGSLITLSSYNKFHNNCYRDTIVVCVVNCATSVYAGFAIFSVLGHMAHVQDKPIAEVVQSGFGLVFIAYPEALVQLPWAPLWSILFFFMLLTLGLNTQFADLETVITALLDLFPKFLRTKRLYLTIGICLISYFPALLCVTQAGIYWLNLMDHFCSGWLLISIALVELISLSWIYGANRFIKDIEMMIGQRTWLFWLWWRVCWLLISPCLLAIILLWSLVTYAPPRYGPVEYPVWAIALGWCMTTFCIMWIPIVAIVRVVQAEGSTLWQKLSAACTAAPDWGPFLKQHKGERYGDRADSAELSNSVQLLATPEM
ncbi:sodium- and chloride-dependent neutral and basic amino acid transporter B(0+)-like [Hemiscyllium ocellatum]|uniref:sodium- and chloride-dependent neutral and basic amino acid transporter B(0+)-like n=1 Tax=Hemiscyllium ocellatum TaxID=170820 RepID=UPI002966CC1B|nr:sodium- and chloride-dependent neutral and basic amino acid transporter B(0+)-like [Hemiscyllium ocellatum]